MIFLENSVNGFPTGNYDTITSLFRYTLSRATSKDTLSVGFWMSLNSKSISLESTRPLANRPSANKAARQSALGQTNSSLRIPPYIKVHIRVCFFFLLRLYHQILNVSHHLTSFTHAHPDWPCRQERNREGILHWGSIEILIKKLNFHIYLKIWSYYYMFFLPYWFHSYWDWKKLHLPYMLESWFKFSFE